METHWKNVGIDADCKLATSSKWWKSLDMRIISKRMASDANGKDEIKGKRALEEEYRGQKQSECKEWTEEEKLPRVIGIEKPRRWKENQEEKRNLSWDLR